MERKNAKNEILAAYLLNFKPRKILTSYILSSLRLNVSINQEKLEKIEKLIVKLDGQKFFDNLGGYYENHATIEMIFSLLNDINNFNPNKSQMFMTQTIAERLDSALKLKKKISQEYLHEATFLVMDKDRKIAKEFKISCLKFLEIFGFKNEACMNILADQVTVSLRLNKSISKIKMPTLQINENYEQLILSEDCDIFFHEKWFVPQNEFLQQLESSELHLERREEEKDIDDECIVPEEHISTNCNAIQKNNSELNFKSMINDVICKTNSLNSSKWNHEKIDLQNHELDSSNCLYETVQDNIPEKVVVTDILLCKKNEEKKPVETNIICKNPEKKKVENCKLKILSGNISNKNSINLSNSGFIKITNSDFQINNGDIITHKGTIKLGRKGGDADITMGEINNGGISRNQFVIQVKNNDIFVQCCSPPPKPTTTFRVNEIPFFLEKDQVK